MIPTPLPLKAALAALVIALTGFIAGCGDSVQKTAYEHAVALEQQLPVDRAPAIIAEYREVIRLEPGSAWATQAQTRIDAVQAKVKAEELRKSVFHEHGID